MTDITRYSENPIAPGNELMKLIHEGMAVVNAAGKRIGHVGYVSMGDPQAATLEGNDLRRPDFLSEVGMTLFGDEREPDVEEPLRSQLLHDGFIKIEGDGLFGTDRYARSTEVVQVSDDTVVVNAPTRELPVER